MHVHDRVRICIYVCVYICLYVSICICIQSDTVSDQYMAFPIIIITIHILLFNCH